MSLAREYMERSPVWARVLPFGVFVLLTQFQGQMGEGSYYWVYFAKTIVGAWLVWEMWPLAKEVRWAFSWEAVVVGIAVFAIWVGLDPYYKKFSTPDHVWNPHDHFGEGSALAWLIIVTRIAGSTLVVPPIEEAFYRSFLYRYLVKIDFLQMPLGRMHLLSFFTTSIIFGLLHFEWLAGILCGLAYQWLVIRKDRLGDAMTAHAITNLLLGIWVVWRGAWNFW